MPKLKIRSMIYAPKGYELVACDLSQAESWIVAHLANEHNMKRALKTGDIHAETAVAFFHQEKIGCEHIFKSEGKNKRCNFCDVLVLNDERYLGKKGNHATSYGATPERQVAFINQESDKPPYITVTLAETKQMNKAWHDYYNVRGWWEFTKDQLNKSRTLTTPYGRVRMFFEAWGNELFKEAYAFVPQSTVADHFNGKVHPQLGIEGGFLTLHKRHVRKGYYTIINHAHDSVLMQIPKPVSNDLLAEIRSIIERPCVVNGEEFTIPVDGERGERYGEMEPIDWKKAA